MGLLTARRLRKQLDKEIKKAPKYEIQDEAFDNKAIAMGQAFGRDRSIQMQEQGLEQDTSNAIGAAKDITSSTSGLLATIAAINANKDSTTRDLATNEAQLQMQKKDQLLGVNSQMIDEKDKAWNYNKNMPYQMKVAGLRDRIKFNQEMAAGAAGAIGNMASSWASMGGGMGGGGGK